MVGSITEPPEIHLLAVESGRVLETVSNWPEWGTDVKDVGCIEQESKRQNDRRALRHKAHGIEANFGGGL